MMKKLKEILLAIVICFICISAGIVEATPKVKTANKSGFINLNRYMECNKLWNKEHKKTNLSNDEITNIKACNNDFKWAMLFSDKHRIHFSLAKSTNKQESGEQIKQLVTSFYDFFMLFSEKKSNYHLKNAGLKQQLKTLYKQFKPLDLVFGKNSNYHYELKVPNELSLDKSEEYAVPKLVMSENIKEIDLLPPKSIATHVKPNYKLTPRYTLTFNKGYAIISKKLIAAIEKNENYELIRQRLDGRVLTVKQKEDSGQVISFVLRAKDDGHCILFVQDKKFYLYSVDDYLDIIESVLPYQVKKGHYVKNARS